MVGCELPSGLSTGFRKELQNLEGKKMTEANYAKRAAKLKAGLTVANTEAQRFEAALVTIKSICQRRCGCCGDFAGDVAARVLENNYDQRRTD
jgi:hypothetical protein